MQSLRKIEIIIGLWWKKFQKLNVLYLLFFIVLYYTAACKWVTAKPVSIVDKFIPLDLSTSYNGLELSGNYIWVLLLPFVFSVALFNSIAIFIILSVAILTVLLKIYDSYKDLDSDFIFKEYIMSMIKIEYHTEMYLFFIVLLILAVFGLINIILKKTGFNLR
jgi:hypothetical protein